MLITTCNDCEKKPTCTSLCPEANAFADQDKATSPYRKLSTDYIDKIWAQDDVFHSENSPSDNPSRDFLIAEKIIVEKCSQREVARMFGVSQPMICKIINRIRARVQDTC